MTNLDSILKSRDIALPKKGLYSQSYGFSSSQVQMWELDRKEGWVPKTMLWYCGAGKDWDSLGNQGDQTNLKGNQPWIFTGKTDAEAPILWLLLLLSCFSRVRLCATPQTAAHQAPPSLGWSRQEYWSGLPFLPPMHESEKSKWSRSVVSDS